MDPNYGVDALSWAIEIGPYTRPDKSLDSLGPRIVEATDKNRPYDSQPVTDPVNR